MHEISIGVLVAALGALDELCLCQWPAHHCPFYTGTAHRVPIVRGLALVVLGLAIASCGGDGAEPVTAELRDVRSFEPVGTVKLEEREGGTRVEVRAPDVEDASSPAIRGGFCAELRPREHKLSEFAGGRSVTDLNAPLEELLERQAKVTVSRGENTPHRVAACTELPFEGQEPEVVIVDLLGPNGTDKGLAWVEPGRPGRTKVGILLYDVIHGPRPAMITSGSCKGESVHELTEISDSESVTEVEARLEALTDDDHWVVAGTACGAIQSAE
jgi:hypothetical protein